MADLELNSIGNGDGNNYLVRDNTKIPLAGSNQISGSLIPATDNSIDIGSSTKNLKMLYTKGITIDSAQFLPSDYIPRSGGAVISGNDLCKTVDTSRLSVRGGTNTNGGATITMYGKDWTDSTYKGAITLGCYDGSNSYAMKLYTNGTLTWGSKNVAMQEDVIPRSGGSVMTGETLYRIDNNGSFIVSGGTAWNTGGRVILRGANHSTEAGCVVIQPANFTMLKYMRIWPDGTWTWEGTACQVTSDQRLKQQIAKIDDKLLDAWEDVELSQFKYNDAVDEKGKDKARLHTGYVVQQIDEACKSHGVDISAYGLYCHEEYPQETEEIEVENEDGTKTKETKVIREASEHYSLRYTEALIVECAYLRKKNKDLQEQLNALSERLEKLENR